MWETQGPAPARDRRRHRVGGSATRGRPAKARRSSLAVPADCNHSRHLDRIAVSRGSRPRRDPMVPSSSIRRSAFRPRRDDINDAAGGVGDAKAARTSSWRPGERAPPRLETGVQAVPSPWWCCRAGATGVDQRRRDVAGELVRGARRSPRRVGRRRTEADGESANRSGQVSHHPDRGGHHGSQRSKGSRRRGRRGIARPEPAATVADGDAAGGPCAALDVDRRQHRRQRPRLAATAVAQANLDGGGDTIVFSSLFDTPQTITLTNGQLELSGTAGTTTIQGPGEPAVDQRRQREPGLPGRPRRDGRARGPRDHRRAGTAGRRGGRPGRRDLHRRRPRAGRRRHRSRRRHRWGRCCRRQRRRRPRRRHLRRRRGRHAEQLRPLQRHRAGWRRRLRLGERLRLHQRRHRRCRSGRWPVHQRHGHADQLHPHRRLGRGRQRWQRYLYGGVGGAAQGGGLFNNDTATLTSCTFTGNSTMGGSSGGAYLGFSGSGGAAQGGGLDNDTSGTATLSDCTLSGNSTVGGHAAAAAVDAGDGGGARAAA